MLAILGRCIKSKKFGIGMRCIWIRKSGRQIEDFGKFRAPSVTGLAVCWSGQRWRWLWSWLSASVEWRCTCSFASPACLQMLWGSILARKASGHVILTKHSQVSFNRSLHLFMPRTVITLHLLFSDLGVRFDHQIFCFLYCGAQTPFFGHFCHIQGQAHVSLFQLYPTSLPCHCSRHVKNLQDISCCL